MSEELSASDEPTELVAAQSWNVVDSATLRLGDSVPALYRRARGSDSEAVLLLKSDQRRFDANTVDHHLQLRAQDKGTVYVAKSSAQTARIESLVNAIDSDPDIPFLPRYSLRDHLELVCLELGTVPVIRVRETPSDLVTRPAGFDVKTGAQVTNRSFAPLTVLAQELATTFG
jgi:hypothetical protein